MFSCFRLFGLHPARLHFCYTLQVKNPPPVSQLLIKSRAQAVREPGLIQFLLENEDERRGLLQGM